VSSVDFVSEHGTASLHGSEGHYLASLPGRLTVGLLGADSLRARETWADIITPDSSLHIVNDIAFGTFFGTAWRTGVGDDFAWRGHPLGPYHISLNTALALGGDPLRFACRFDVAGFPWVDGEHRAWLAGIIDEGLSTGLFRGPHQGWDEVTALLRARDDEPVAIAFSGSSPGFPNPYLGGWFPAELGEDYTKLTEQQQREWDVRADAWYEIDDAEQWRIAVPALRANRKEGMEMRPDTWRELYFGNGLTVFDLLAPDRAERLDKAFGLEPVR
jgi:hypothetical protein